MPIPTGFHASRVRGSLLAAVALAGGCAAGDPEWAEFVPTAPSTELGPTEPASSIAPNLQGSVRLSADPTAFQSGVERAAAGDRAYALPALEVRDGTGLFLTVGTLIALVSGVDAGHLLSNTVECEAADAQGCAEEFERAISSQNARLGAALGPYARVVSEGATSVQAVTWTPVRNGFPQLPVVSLQGIRNGRVLGIVVFR
jgi:hypothetical protein